MTREFYKIREIPAWGLYLFIVVTVILCLGYGIYFGVVIDQGMADFTMSDAQAKAYCGLGHPTPVWSNGQIPHLRPNIDRTKPKPKDMSTLR